MGESQDSKIARIVAIASEGGPAQEIAPYLYDSTPSVVSSACFYLGQIGAREYISELENKLEESNNEVLNLCISGLSQMIDHRGTHLVAPLHRLLDHTDLLVRLSAIEALGAIRSESSVSVLLARFSGSSQAEKAQMAHALGRIGHQSALPALRVYLDEVQAMDHSIPRKGGVRGSDPHPDALEIIVDEAISSIEAQNA